MALAITIVFCSVAGLVVLWALVMVVRSHQRWRRGSHSLDKTIEKVRREQLLLAEGLVPEFSVIEIKTDCSGLLVPVDRMDLMRRYLAGEDIPLTWRLPRKEG